MNIFRLYPWILFLFTLIRFVLPLKIGVRWKAVIAVILLAISQQRFISRTVFQTMASTELPYGVIIIQGFLLSIIALLTVFVLFRDIAGLTFRLCRQKRCSPLSSSGRLAIWLCAIAVLLSAVGIWRGVRVPDVRKQEIVINNLPAGLDGFTIVQLTDLHVTRLFSEKWVRAVVDKANALEPDLILITGDIVDGTLERRFTDAAPLGELKSGFGVFGVPGNHDYSSDYEGWMNAFKKLGIRILLNEHAVITHGDSSLALIGIPDKAAVRRGRAAPDIEAALSGAPEGVTKILMSHQADNARENASAGIDLQLSGHTHGGQIIGLHFIVKYANKGFASGLYEVGNMRLYVSNGTGLWTGFPVRLGRSSEITHITLKAASENPKTKACG
jgi:predicted MPP superfamily phosphohydrolase